MNSVCLATYNGEKYIQAQLESILSQLNTQDEIIIGDDGSVDNTIQIIEALNDKRIRIMKNNFKNHVKNFEVILKMAKGDYIFLSDQDDVWLSDKYNICLKALKNHDVVISDCYYTDEKLNPIIAGRFTNALIEKLNNRSLIQCLLYGAPHLGCCMSFKRKILDICLPFPESTESHDRWIGFSARLKFNVHYIPNKLVYCRRHNLNQSNINGRDMLLTGKSEYSLVSIIFRRFLLIFSLFKRKISNSWDNVVNSSV